MATDAKKDTPKRKPVKQWPKRIHVLYSTDEDGKLNVLKATRKAEEALAAFDGNREANIASFMVD